MNYLLVKHLHIMFVVLTLCLFALRFGMRWAKPHKPLAAPLRIVPHINDTLLLLSGLWLMHMTRWIPFANANWLGVKLLLLLVYIGAGTVAIKALPRSGKSVSAFAVSMLCVALMVWLAVFKPF